MNVLTERREQLAEMDHSVLLEATLRALQGTNPFAVPDDGRLRLNADAVARAVLAQRTWNERAVVALPPKGVPSSCTGHATPAKRDGSRDRLRQVHAQLARHLADIARARDITLAELVRGHTANVRSVSPFGSLYPEAAQELARSFAAARRRLTFVRRAATGRAPTLPTGPARPLMRWHKLTITVEVPRDVVTQIGEAVKRHLEARLVGLSADDRRELGDVVGEQVVDPRSELAQLARAIDTETLGQLKKAAALHYLELLAAETGDDPGKSYAQDTVRRLRALQRHLGRDDVADEAYEVVHLGRAYNLRTLFAQADAFQVLPVFPLIGGSLGKTTDWHEGRRSYILGLKLKLNGAVTRFGRVSSFDYHLGLLEGRYETRADRLLRLTVLYYTVFTRYGDATFDPGEALDRDLLPRLRSSSAQSPGSPPGATAAPAARRQPSTLDGVGAAVAASCRSVDVKRAAESLRRLVRRTAPFALSRRDVQIAVRGGIVLADRAQLVTEGRLLKDVFGEDSKAYLGYIDVADPQILPDAVFKLRANLTVEDVQCFDAEVPAEPCTVTYDPQDRVLLPVFLTTLDQPPRTATPGARPGQSTPGIVVTCFERDGTGGAGGAARATEGGGALHLQPARWFVYRYVFTLVTYLGLRLLAAAGPKPLFISLARAHHREDAASEKDDPDGFLATLGKVLAHVLATDFQANSQGLLERRAKQREAAALRNAAASLYAPLTKHFRFQAPLDAAIDRLAIVVVSSRECDGIRGDRDGRLATVYGEVIEVALRDGSTVAVSRAGTFGGTYAASELYVNPTVITDKIHELYASGHRHVVYVAQSPYSTTLHVTRSAGSNGSYSASGGSTSGVPFDDGLFFLSEPIIQACVRDKPGLHLYPVFRDQYHAMKLGPLGATALYVQDTLELTRVVDDRSPSRQMVVFLNLFSGAAVAGNSDDSKYHGVVSYATLLNSYGGVLDDQDLRTALVYDEQADGTPNRLKATIVLYLTLFHLSRYEVSRRELALKLDPYSDVIGDESVGAFAMRSHIRPGLRFNFLGFLTEVRNAAAA